MLIPKLDFVEPLRLECAHFVGCISEGTTPLTDGDGLRVVRILEAATLSIERGGVAVSMGGLKAPEREG